MPDVQGIVVLEDDDDALAKARARSTGGVCVRGAQEEDAPGTWETLVSPHESPELRGAGNPSPRTVRARGRARAVAGPPRSRNEQAPAAR